MELYLQVFKFLLALFYPSIFIFFPIIIFFVIFLVEKKKYEQSSYFQITKYPYHSVRRDSGRYGEYLTYKNLKDFEEEGAKFLFNTYIPKEKGGTTEIDLLMICSKGILVFESKNYSGWIFGSENQKNWYQTLPIGRGRSRKTPFYNPIMQNRSHIKHLKSILNDQIPMRSIIVFSDRCTLKSVQFQSDDVSVIKRSSIYPVMSAIFSQTPTDFLSPDSITEIFNRLYPFSQTDEITKKQHIDNIVSHRARAHQHTSAIYITPIATPVQEETCKTSESIQTPMVQLRESLTSEINSLEPQILKCPRCNGNLILRKVSRGTNVGNQFYGCSNFPKCKYTRNKLV